MHGGITRVARIVHQRSLTMPHRSADQKNKNENYASSPIAGLAVGLVAVLAASSAAQAYSNTAVQAASEILKTVEVRFQVGEVLKSDVELATYNLADMRYRASQISETEFCKTAQPHLKAVVEAFDEAEGRAGEKKKWLDEIASMGASPSQCRQAVATADRLLFGASSPDVAESALKNAVEAQIETELRFGAGEISSVDRDKASYRVLEVKFAEKKIAQATYCQTGVPALLTISTGTEYEGRVGQRSLRDVIAAKRAFFAAETLCAADLHASVQDMLAARRRGAVHMDKKDFDGAIATLTEALRTSPQDVDFIIGRAGAYEAKQDHVRAIADYSTALSLDAMNTDALRGRADANFSSSNFDSAIVDYTALIQQEPGDLAALINRGTAFMYKMTYSKAIADYTAALDRGPTTDPFFRFHNMKDVLTQRAYVYTMMKDFDHAIADYSQLLGIDPKNVAALNDRGFAYYSKAVCDRAILDLTAALELDPNNIRALATRAAAYQSKADYPKAISDYSKVVQLDRGNVNALLGRAMAYDQLKKYDPAIADYSEIVRVSPNNADAYNDRCWDRAISGHAADAVADCDQSLRLRPNDANALDSRGFTHLALGELDAAIADYDLALKLSPKLDTALYGRGVARSRKGDNAGGHADIAAAIAINANIAGEFTSYGVK
jgi:tetratricopeptide (TPR) repeat protein